MASHSSSPALARGQQSTSHSPYHVLAQLTAGLAEGTKALTKTHAEFVKTQKSIYKTGAEVSSLLSSVKTGIQIEELALDNVGGSVNSYKKAEEAISAAEPTKRSSHNGGGGGGSGAHSSGRVRRSRATDNIYKANTEKTDFGSNESDPIIID